MLSSFLASSRRLVVLTGAGCSTESGIPDYRSPGGAWTRHKPIYFSSFVRSAEVRRFYWARSYRGWPRFDNVQPNDAHRALAELESRGAVHQLITQNVDDLHQEAGSRAVVQLHGRNRVVVCLETPHRHREHRPDPRRRAGDAEDRSEVWCGAARGTRQAVNLVSGIRCQVSGTLRPGDTAQIPDT
jgi:NAD-dependent SIR2 family protein deacetylase